MKSLKKRLLSSYELKMLKRVYEPYRLEAITQLVPWLILAVIAVLAFSILVYYDGLSWKIVLAAAIIGCYLYIYWRQFFRYLFYSVLEIRFLKKQKAYLTIVAIKGEDTFTPRRTDNFMVDLYDKKMRVDRYQIVCRNAAGKRIVLRCAMSQKRHTMLYDALHANQTLPCSVTYGKFTHLIWHFDNKNDAWADVFNHTF